MTWPHCSKGEGVGRRYWRHHMYEASLQRKCTWIEINNKNIHVWSLVMLRGTKPFIRIIFINALIIASTPVKASYKVEARKLFCRVWKKIYFWQSYGILNFLRNPFWQRGCLIWQITCLSDAWCILLLKNGVYWLPRRPRVVGWRHEGDGAKARPHASQPLW